jgi:hypothetical protein
MSRISADLSDLLLRLLLLGKLHIRPTRADQHGDAAERLTNSLSEVVLGIGVCLGIP